MSDFDPHISVETISTAKDAPYTIKEMTLDHLNRSIETPFKVLSGTKISRKAIGNRITGIPFPIFESSKYLIDTKTYAGLNRILQGGSWISGLNRMMGVDNNVVKDFNTTVSLVFRHYPLNDVVLRNTPAERVRMDFSLYEGLLDYVYAASSAFILTPDVCLPQNNRTISIEQYLSFISRSVESFERKNNKPIFVPLQVDLGVSDLKKILEFYKREKYSNIWIDFNAKACDNTYSARLRQMDRLLGEYLGNDYILYSSHMQKDIQPQLRNPQAAASDILPQYLGSDFVGITRSPYRSYRPLMKQDEEIARDLGMTLANYRQTKFEHTHRIFDPNTYYYYYPSAHPFRNELPDLTHVTSEQIGLLNSLLINREFSHAREVTQETGELRPFLLEKQSLLDNPILLGNIRSPRQPRFVQTTLSPSDDEDPFQFLGKME